MNTIFMGTPQFAVPSLQILAGSVHKPSLVITQPDRPKGRNRRLQPTVVKLAAQELGIPVFQPEDVNLPENLAKIAELEPDLIITAAYGGYLKKNIRNLPVYKCINLHPSLLPLYRGAAPVNYSLFNGDKVTGISIFQLTAKMDAGPLLWQREIEISESDNYTSLLKRLSEEGAIDLLKVIDNIEDLMKNKTDQDDSKASFSSKIDKKDTFINWNNKALQILNLIRGLAEIPGATAGFRENRIKLIEAETVTCSAAAGVITAVTRSGITVAAQDQGLIIKKVQPAGKKIMSAYAFNLGARIRTGEKFTNGY